MTRHTAETTTSSAESTRGRRFARISRLEWAVAAAVVIVMIALVVAEPDILEAPFENTRTIAFTVGGTIVAAIALVLMLRFRVPAPVRVVVLGVPFVAVSWWLLSPFFIDDVVNDEFETSIAVAAGQSDPSANVPGAETSTTAAPNVGSAPTAAPNVGSTSTSVDPASGPALLGAGQFIGLAGHEGTGDAGIFRLADGAHVLRFENFDIQNGPDLRLYLVPGADQTSPVDGSLYLGGLRGNVGNQTYELPTDFTPTAGDWTVLVWCEAFSVEFVGASISIA
jgi:hypothetical protein